MKVFAVISDWIDDRETDIELFFTYEKAYSKAIEIMDEYDEDTPWEIEYNAEFVSGNPVPYFVRIDGFDLWIEEIEVQ